MTVKYNENDPLAAQWLRNLIIAGHIPAGDVDERSIVDLRPADLVGYSQVHFFAGIGGWAHALRLAGWPDDRPIWTGSCPCQPFSNAGKGAGTNDPRHLWPYLMDLIGSGRPPVVMGEQVAGSAGYGWFDGVRADLAGQGYSSRGVDIPACAVDAPHIRQRLYWVAVAGAARRRAQHVGPGEGASQGGRGRSDQDSGSHGGVLAIAGSGRPFGRADKSSRDDPYGPETGWNEGSGGLARGDALGVAPGDAESIGRREGWPEHGIRSGRGAATCADAQGVALGDAYVSGLEVGPRQPGNAGAERAPAERTNLRGGSFWSNHDRLLCHDGKTRRTKPGVPLLVDGVRGRVAFGLSIGEAAHPQADQLINRVGAWKGAGNAIVPQAAEQVIRAFMDVHP